MKKRIIQLIVAGAFVISPLFMFGQPNPNENASGNAVSGAPIGGGGTAPIGGGIALLITMAIGYGAKSVFNARQKFE